MKYLHVLRLVPPYRAVSYRKDERTGQGSHSCHHILYETALGCIACASAGGMQYSKLQQGHFRAQGAGKGNRMPGSWGLVLSPAAQTGRHAPVRARQHA